LLHFLFHSNFIFKHVLSLCYEKTSFGVIIDLMKINEVVDTISGKILCGENHTNMNVEFGFASDMMSDVLTLLEDDILLITGLANAQAIRTAVMSDVKNIVIARGKVVTDDMIELANDSDISIIASPFSLYKISGLLYNQGLKAIY